MTTPPSSELPKSREEWRFHHMGTPVEWIEDYRPGRYHPVHFGDTVKDSRYRVIRKLGYGSFSTVWLARDRELNRYVALKILMAKPGATQNELAIHQALSQSTSQHQGKSNLMTLIDFFEHEGPNGVHQCLVFEVMGPSVASAVEELPDNLIEGSGYERRYPIWMAKSILRQTLLGIDFLHQNGVAHGDMQQENLLFPVKDLNSISEDELSGKNEVSEPVKRVDGKEDIWAPRYLAVDRSLTEYVNIEPGFKMKISDLGGAFFISDPPEELVTPVGLRSPELIFEKKVSKDQDLWSFGCLIFELVTGEQLFPVGSAASDEKVDDDHFLQFYDVLGPLPSRLIAQYPRTHLYCNEAGEIIMRYIGKIPKGADPAGLEPLPSLEEFFDEVKPEYFSAEEAEVVKKLLRWILDYDPAKRPSASELLKHPWFAVEDAQ